MTSFTDDGSRLHAAVHCDGDHTVVTLTGELDRVSGPPLVRLLDLALDGSSGHLDLRLAQLGFIDIGGVRILLQVRMVAEDRGVKLTLHDPQPHVRWLIDTMGGAGPLLGDSTPAPAPAAVTRPWDPPPALAGPAEKAAPDPRDERDRRADERDDRAADRDRLADERDRLADERQRCVREHQRWEDIREDLADTREADLERREREQ
ncbi:STAS domain-containing protein [Nucisporomicrobium flavum]|uniref:STAS domain-containing protein n=1 Tax=Nucisporomicrobium flavum TaxID=2785915 RepID=UPI0018F75FA7|nr:STAS domain-containing protein [Nucisporomicrobium flavum]